MTQNLKNQFLLLILPFCFLFVAPFTHGMQGSFDDEKSADTSDDYTISNPIVFLAGASKYDQEKDCLPTVKTEMEILYNLFHNKCEYEVRSTFFDEKGNIFPKHPKEEKKKMDGEWLYKEKFDQWLDDQYDYLRKNIKSKKYDALFFIFSGHGSCDEYEREVVITSDEKRYFWGKIQRIFSLPSHSDLEAWAAKSPKFFFKIACRGDTARVVVKSKGSKTVNLASKTYTFYATSKGNPVSVTNGVHLASLISKFFLKAMQEHCHLSWIDNRIKEQMSKTKYTLDAPASYSGLVTDKVFFAPRRKIMDENAKNEWLAAAQKGNLNKLKNLFKFFKINVNAKDKDGENALHNACLFSGSVEMVTWLLGVCKLGIEAKGFQQKTPFLCAAGQGQLAIAKLLKKQGANVNAKSNTGNNALHYACLFSGSVAMTAWLLDECKIPLETKGRYQKTPFLSAAEKGQLAIAKLLKERGANIHAKSKDGNNALHTACLYSGTVEMVTWLLDECKIPIETKGNLQQTPFLCAAEKGQLSIAKLLRKQGANIDATDEGGYNALHTACLFGSAAMVTWLLDECKLGLEAKGQYEATPFICAAEQGQLAIAKLLKKQGANLNAKSNTGNNALHKACLFSGSVEMTIWLLNECNIDIETKGKNQKTPFLCAAAKGQLAIAKLLKERGTNIHATNEFGNNALHEACFFSGSVAMVDWLLDKCKIGIETKGKNQKTPFLCTAEEGQLAIAKLLRQRGADINAKDKDGDNALHFACLFSGSVDMITWLLDVCKIGLEAKGFNQQTPFLSAAQKGQLAIAKLLRQRGADINAKNEYGNNALHLACAFSGSEEMVTWLLNVCHIDIESKGNYQQTPFLCAANNRQLAIAKLLRQRGANIYAKSEDGDNALHFACFFSGSAEMVTWLLDVCKIDIESKGRYQRTPFLCTAEKGQLKLAKLLRQQGANINATDKDGDNALWWAKKYSNSEAMINYLKELGLTDD